MYIIGPNEDGVYAGQYVDKSIKSFHQHMDEFGKRCPQRVLLCHEHTDMLVTRSLICMEVKQSRRLRREHAAITLWTHS